MQKPNGGELHPELSEMFNERELLLIEAHPSCVWIKKGPLGWAGFLLLAGEAARQVASAAHAGGDSGVEEGAGGCGTPRPRAPRPRKTRGKRRRSSDQNTVLQESVQGQNLETTASSTGHVGCPG